MEMLRCLSLLLLLSGDCRCLGALCESMALACIGREKLSLCFKRNGNIVFTSKVFKSRTNGDCSGLFEDFRGLAEDLTLMSKNLFRVVFKTF